jgi:hypothetical protein
MGVTVATIELLYLSTFYSLLEEFTIYRGFGPINIKDSNKLNP